MSKLGQTAQAYLEARDASPAGNAQSTATQIQYPLESGAITPLVSRSILFIPDPEAMRRALEVIKQRPPTFLGVVSGVVEQNGDKRTHQQVHGADVVGPVKSHLFISLGVFVHRLAFPFVWLRKAIVSRWTGKSGGGA